MPSPPPIRYPQPGTVVLGKYCVESVIGEGGMGAVLKARHLDLDESVAIKVLLPDHMERPEIVARFLREAKASVKLKGEHVARVLDVGRLEDEFAGTPYIVMEFLDGADLNAIIKHHGAQDPAVAADLMLQACEAIAEAHSLGIIHRDIKASNFFITQPEEQAPELKVLDFGIATAPQGTSDLTSTQSVIGTPAYMAPEQMRASRQADTRSDVWSMGVVLYELLEGARPFRSTVYSDLCLAVGMDPPEPMEQAVPEALHAVVLRCLEKTVERRYQSVAELAFDLVPFATDPVLARASVEQCARLLGRRGQRVFDASRAPDDLTPAAITPAPRTPLERSTRGGRQLAQDADGIVARSEDSDEHQREQRRDDAGVADQGSQSHRDRGRIRRDRSARRRARVLVRTRSRRVSRRERVARRGSCRSAELATDRDATAGSRTCHLVAPPPTVPTVPTVPPTPTVPAVTPPAPVDTKPRVVVVKPPVHVVKQPAHPVKRDPGDALAVPSDDDVYKKRR